MEWKADGFRDKVKHTEAHQSATFNEGDDDDGEKVTTEEQWVLPRVKKRWSWVV